MTQRSFGALVVLNVVLLLALVVVNLAPQPAAAQGLGGGADYLMIAGKTTGRANLSTVYLVEIRSAMMIAAQFDTRTNAWNVMNYRSLQQDIRH